MSDVNVEPIDTSLTGGYAFLLNVRSVPDIEHAAILPEHVIRRATDGEVATIKKILKRLGSGSQFHIEYLWDQVWPDPDGTLQLLPRDQWRYYVIAFNGTSEAMTELAETFPLSMSQLVVGLTILPHSSPLEVGCTFDPAHFFHTLESVHSQNWEFRDITRADVDDMRQLFTDFQVHDHGLIDLRRVTSEVRNLDAMPHGSPLRFLGYFALLESLLTHAPQPTDPYDSITRQVKKKLALLSHRFKTSMDSKFFGSPHETLWSKMYAYRSTIAHGGEPDFKGKLAILKGPGEALRLLRETTIAVARHALREPQLLVDLREC